MTRRSWARDTLPDSETQLTTSVRGDLPLRSLLRLLRPHRTSMVVAVGAFVVKDSPIWILPPVTAAIVDIVVAGGPLWHIGAWAGVALACLALNYPFTMIVVRLTSSATRSLAYTVRTGLAARLQRLSLGFHNRQSASLVQTKIVRDVENLELMIAQLFPTIVSACATLVGAIVVTAVAVPWFVAVFAIAIPVAASLIVYIRRRAADRNAAFRREVERLSAQVSEMAALLPITRGHGLEDVATERVAARADSVRRAGRDLDILNGRFGALSWISYQVLGLVCLVAAAALSVTRVLPISPGQVVLLSTYFGLLTNSIVMLMNVAPTLARGMDAMRSIADVAEELDVEDSRGGRRLDDIRGSISLRDVHVRFDDGDGRPALAEVTLDVPAGSTVAFVGPSGSGKSTILNVVLGFVRPSSGEVLVDGHCLADVDLRSLRRRISIVPQETVLMAGTVRDNVAYGACDVDDADIVTALREADALDIVDGSREGLDTLVGERGAGLSGGQRQRLAIARALVRDPRILVLDEATSALDGASERRVSAALERARRGRTTLIVAHRLSTVRGADLIAVVEDGRIVEIGAHDDLIRRNGPYSQLATAGDS
ncbi:ABC transporter ATP-binding protein [Microbacterium ulmi]|uniref:ABC transporter ATP-binding protein n=1 Tax=Microbacterium ulmi TaxID=179095 RepID=A0A7Y2LZS4_9MICO|nr:ABC transporter ATP-binding protein [Microbacterium ulmi]NII69904.1 ATP-binding cassette subfamily B protein [Microbacterium ulmi]NNH03824.1 ABC transporter ATP-binding protein [Microbacterium ulmi]